MPLKAETVRDVGKNSHELSSHLVSVEGLIDHIQDNPTHCIMNFLSGTTPAWAIVLKEQTGRRFISRRAISFA